MQSQKVSLLPTKSDLKDLRRSPLRDLIAGMTVAVIALPLALAFGAASGLGPAAGITTAIIAGAVAAIFGGSKLQVSGPTGAMTVVLIPVFAGFGAQGVLLVGLMAGILLIAMAVLKLGAHVHRLPTALIEGFTAGIAVIIGLQQLGNLLGVKPAGGQSILNFAFDAIGLAFKSLNLIALIMGFSLASFILICATFWPKVPFSIIAIALATVIANLFDLKVERIGSIPAVIGVWDVGFLKTTHLADLVPAAIAVAVLAALESLLSAKVADRMRGSGEHHDPNREVFGQGLANIAVSLFGGVPATAALARTAVNVRAGANSKLAAFSHAVFLAGIVLLGSSLVGQIPLAALAGVLLATAAHMVKPEELRRTAKNSWLDLIILTATFAVTVFVDIISAVVVGLVLSLLLRKTVLARVSTRLPPIDAEETLGD